LNLLRRARPLDPIDRMDDEKRFVPASFAAWERAGRVHIQPTEPSVNRDDSDTVASST
jgi:hypothetical protein